MERKITGSIRVSSDEQKKKGQQVNFYKDSLMKAGVPEQNIFQELARSGSMDEDKDISYHVINGKLVMEFDLKKKRPELYKWLTEQVMQGKVSKHFVNKWDRLARNIPLGFGLIQICKQHGTEIEAVNDTNDIKLIFLSLTLAQIEAMQTKSRMHDNKSHKFELGLYMGTSRKHGYKKTKLLIDGREFTHLVPDEKELPMIDDIFKHKKNYHEVCKKYKISPQTYYNIIKDKFYIGLVQYKGQEKKGRHMPIVAQEDFSIVSGIK